MALAEDDPYVEELLERCLGPRQPRRCRARELRADAGVGALLLVAVAALALLAPSGARAVAARRDRR